MRAAKPPPVSRAPAYDQLTRWLEDAADRVGATGGCFHLRSREGQRIICQAVTRSVRATHLAYGLELSDCPAVLEALETGRPVAVDDAALDLRVAQIARERFGLKSVLYQPVRIGSSAEAIAIFHHRSPHRWTEEAIAAASAAALEAERILEPSMLGLVQGPSSNLAEAMLSAVPGVTSLIDEGLIAFASSASVRQDVPLEEQTTVVTVDELLADADRGHELRAALRDLFRGELDRFQALFRTAYGQWWVHARPVRLPAPISRRAVSLEARPLEALGVHVQSIPDGSPDALAQSEERHRLEALGRIAGSVAHEVNNALQIIRLSLEELEASEPVETAREATGRAAGVTSQLLTFARKAPTQVSPTNLAEFVTGEIPIVRRAIGVDHALGLRLHSSPAVLLDPRKMSMAC